VIAFVESALRSAEFEPEPAKVTWHVKPEELQKMLTDEALDLPHPVPAGTVEVVEYDDEGFADRQSVNPSVNDQTSSLSSPDTEPTSLLEYPEEVELTDIIQPIDMEQKQEQTLETQVAYPEEAELSSIVQFAENESEKQTKTSNASARPVFAVVDDYDPKKAAQAPAKLSTSKNSFFHLQDTQIISCANGSFLEVKEQITKRN